MSSKKSRGNSKCIFLDFSTFINELCLVIFHFILCHVFFISTKEKLFEIELEALYPLSSLFGNAHKDLVVNVYVLYLNHWMVPHIQRNLKRSFCSYRLNAQWHIMCIVYVVFMWVTNFKTNFNFFLVPFCLFILKGKHGFSHEYYTNQRNNWALT